MTVKRLLAIGFIFVMTLAAWTVLGTTLLVRSGVKGRLAERVEERWGRAQMQRTPAIQDVAAETAVAAESSDINVKLALDYRRMGLLWYATYGVVFDGVYEVKNAGDTPADYLISFQPPADGLLDEFVFEEMNGPQSVSADTTLRLRVPAGQSKKFRLHYKTQGMDYWSYAFGDGLGLVRNFKLTVTTDFKAVDFTTTSPTEPTVETSDGWELTWKYTSTRAQGLTLTIDMPQRQNPGTLAARISFFAPVSLLFFLTVMIVICVMKKVEIHPMNYFFIAAAFFAFHLLLAYLVDHIDVHAAFFISAVVSVLLLVSYLRLVTGVRFALVEAGISQIIFLVGFSCAFFYKGFTGLAVTIAAIITLFVLMQVTGRVKWAEVFQSKPAQAAPKPPAAPPRPPQHLPPIGRKPGEDSSG